MQPEGAHDEEQLNAHCTEWQNSSQSDREGWMGVPHLLWNMPGTSNDETQISSATGKQNPSTSLECEIINGNYGMCELKQAGNMKKKLAL